MLTAGWTEARRRGSTETRGRGEERGLTELRLDSSSPGKNGDGAVATKLTRPDRGHQRVEGTSLVPFPRPARCCGDHGDGGMARICRRSAAVGVEVQKLGRRIGAQRGRISAGNEGRPHRGLADVVVRARGRPQRWKLEDVRRRPD